MTNFITTYIQNYFSGIFSTLVIVTLVYLFFWKLIAGFIKNKKIQPTKRAGSDQIKFEIKNILITSIAGAFYPTIITILGLYGYTKIYFDLNQYGVWYAIFSFVFLWVFDDAWFYWVHRTLHSPRFYKYIHATHHKSLDINPYSSFSFHIIEAALLTIYIVPLSLIMPINAGVLGVLQLVGLFNNIKSHLGYEFYPKFFDKTPLKYLVTSTHHNLHHTRYNGNYGLHFRFWDIICGTEFSDYSQTLEKIKNKKNQTIKDNSVYYKLIITKIKKETKDTVSVYFQKPNSFDSYFAGQYLNLKIKLANKTYYRIFSISSSPNDDYLRVTIKLNGPVSHYFFNDAKQGDSVESLLPSGDFYLDTNKDNSNNYLMIAGGSGITPVFSIIKTLLIQKPETKISLFYANKDPENIIFQDELKQLEKSYNNFEIINFISGQKRIDKTIITDFINKNKDFKCYICGPLGLKKDVKKYLQELGFAKNIYDEDYADGEVKWPV